MKKMKMEKSSTWAIMILLIMVSFSISMAKTSGVTEASLHKIAASLEMYVDELPEMPKLFGYSSDKYGSIKPANLSIGMYQIKWV